MVQAGRWSGRSGRASVNIAPPPIARGLVQRERLMRWLGSPLSAPVVMVTGGAGYGKTTLLVTWAARARDPLAWFTCGPADADPAVFAANLASAIDVVLPGACPATASLLDHPDAPSAGDLGRALADDLSGLSRDLIVVIDNCHLLAGGEAVPLLDSLLEQPPARLHLVLAGRECLPLAPLGRLRLLGLAAELGEAALRFTPEEHGRVIGGEAHKANADDLALALDRLDGWPAGVRLLRQRLQDAPAAPADPLAAVSAIGEALAAEVLDREPPETAAFLESLAVLSRVTGDLAAAMQDGRSPDAAEAVLADLVDRHLFVEREPSDPRAFRIHPLVRGALLARCAAREGREGVAALHRRAAVQLIARHRIDDALSHLLDAGDIDAVVGLLSEQGIDRLVRDDWPRVRRWLGQVPDGIISTSPELLTLRAHVERNQGAFAAARASLDRAAALLEQQPDGPHRRRWWWEIVALRCRADAMGVALAHAREVETAAAEVMAAPDSSWLARSFATFAWVLALQRQGRGDEATTGIDDYLASPQGQHDAVKTYALLGRLSLAFAAVDVAGALASAQATVDAGTRAGILRGPKWGHATVAAILLDLNDLDGAEAAAQRALALAPGEYLGAELEALAALVAVLAARDRHAAAAEAIRDERLRIGLPCPAPVGAALAVIQAELDVASGHHPNDSWLAAAASDVAAPPSRTGPSGATIAVAALLAEGPARAGDALGIVDAALAAAREQHAGWHVARLLPMRALALSWLGRPAEALDTLEASLRFDPGLVRRFLVAGDPMADLLAVAAAERPGLRVRIAPALAAFGRLPSAAIPDAATVLPAPGLRLTRRERQVLERFARHLTNDEIARDLGIAEATVKQHASSLLRKLGVTNRREAARVAQAWLASERAAGASRA